MVKDVLLKFAPIGMDILKKAISKVSVTGKTLNSLKFIVDTTNNRLQYLGRGFMETLETGRGPRKSSTYGHFDNNLEDWMKAKGFSQKQSKSGKTYFKLGEQWFTAKALAWKINKEGDSTYKKGQGKKVKDVYTEEIDAFKEDLIEAIKEDQKQDFKKKILSDLK